MAASGDRGLPLASLAQSESLFALSNGHIGLRGNLDEGEPYGIPGTYLHDIRYGELHGHERSLDFRSGILQRDAEWTSPGGKRIRVRSRRLVSLTQRAVAAIEYVVEPVDDSARFVLQSELVANEAQPPLSADPFKRHPDPSNQRAVS